MAALITPTDAPEKVFSGTVVSLSRASEAPEETEIEILVTSNGELRPGMAVEATIEPDEGEESS
jgi:hypothetical protein